MELYFPYNTKNRFFTESDIHRILRRHGLPHYKIQSNKWFQTAMVHTTYVKRLEYVTADNTTIQLASCPSGCMPLQSESYECLEFEGDAVLGICVTTYLRTKYPEKKQGFLTDARKELVNNERLGQLCQHIGLDAFYVISKHNEESPSIDGRKNTKKLGDIFEAFLGALWTDCGHRFPIVYDFVICCFETYFDIPELLNATTNFKNIFQKVCQRDLKCTPTYKLLSNDPKKNEIKVAVCDAEGNELGYGSSTTRKKAEQLACQDALNKSSSPL
jgi:ribonuclease-3